MENDCLGASTSAASVGFFFRGEGNKRHRKIRVVTVGRKKKRPPPPPLQFQVVCTAGIGLTGRVHSVTPQLPAMGQSRSVFDSLYFGVVLFFFAIVGGRWNDRQTNA